MKKFLRQFLVSLLIVLAWRLALGAFLMLSQPNVNPQFPYYQSDLAQKYEDVVTVWAHFDGIHYLRIADYWYRDMGTQAFFPLYPLAIKALTPLFPSPLITAQFISLLSLALALTGLRYLFPTLKLYAICLILIFPTSFYFASVYTESLFLALSVWFFVFLSKKWWLGVALLAALASATRFAGIFLSLSLLYELYRAKISFPKTLCLMLIAVSGLSLYMYYLYFSFGDPLLFIHVQPIFGGGRSGGEIILLPQVIWRYLKIFATADIQTLTYTRSIFEFATFSFLGYLLIRFYIFIPLSHFIYLGLSLLLPTFSGTLSSFPRYALVLFPFFLPLLPLQKYHLLYLVSLILLIWSFATFASGYFLA